MNTTAELGIVSGDRRSAADDYAIGSFPRPTGEIRDRVDTFISELRADKPYFLGFPANLDFSFSGLSGLLDIFVNNVGDPRSTEKAAISAKPMECAVVDAITELANGRPEHTYGYVGASGSEANLFGLDRGCTLLPDAKIYCSAATHYSVRKAARLMRKELVVLDCDESGRMDVDALADACRRDAGRGAVVVATLGTTMTGAIDDVDAIVDAAASAGRVYVHLDAALGGLIVPFTEHGTTWGFAKAEVGSLAISMHKGLGMPVPCALALCRAELVRTAVEGEYVGATDATLGCSRAGMASVLLWYALSDKGIAGLEQHARRALTTAEYAVTTLAASGLNPMRHRESIIVVFDRPAEWICRKYYLATEGERAHIVTLPHVRESMIDSLCLDILEPGAAVTRG
ncbi:histidine decarboxylase [Nocardia sp. A7]|uniref:histidine decarboxylase n=1 Tax=Nocardia sp. A7 TaxID=2789274 RepID=UPI00397DD362